MLPLDDSRWDQLDGGPVARDHLLYAAADSWHALERLEQICDSRSEALFAAVPHIVELGHRDRGLAAIELFARVEAERIRGCWIVPSAWRVGYFRAVDRAFERAKVVASDSSTAVRALPVLATFSGQPGIAAFLRLSATRLARCTRCGGIADPGGNPGQPMHPRDAISALRMGERPTRLLGALALRYGLVDAGSLLWWSETALSVCRHCGRSHWREYPTLPRSVDDIPRLVARALTGHGLALQSLALMARVDGVSWPIATDAKPACVVEASKPGVVATQGAALALASRLGETESSETLALTVELLGRLRNDAVVPSLLGVLLSAAPEAVHLTVVNALMRLKAAEALWVAADRDDAIGVRALLGLAIVEPHERVAQRILEILERGGLTPKATRQAHRVLALCEGPERISAPAGTRRSR